MPAVALCPTAGILFQAFTSGGLPLNAGLLYTYIAGGTTPTATYTTSAGNVQHANPIQLDADGRTPTEVWLVQGVTYRLDLADSLGNLIKSFDNVTGINDLTLFPTTVEWAVFSGVPTFVSGTSFTLTGNQTGTFQVGRRVKTTNTGGTAYSTILTSAFGVLTTITVVNDSIALDSGLSAVSYGILAATNPSSPMIIRAAGDILQASSTGALARLAIGTARQVPTVNAGATALAYQNPITLTAIQATTSGSTWDFTGIPSGVRRVTIDFSAVSLSGTNDILVQIGDAGGFETTGYVSSSGVVKDAAATAVRSSTTSFVIKSGDAANLLSGRMVLDLFDAATFHWVSAHSGKLKVDETVSGGGNKSLSQELTQVRITTSVADTGDSGAVVISYE